MMDLLHLYRVRVMLIQVTNIFFLIQFYFLLDKILKTKTILPSNLNPLHGEADCAYKNRTCTNKSCILKILANIS